MAVDRNINVLVVDDYKTMVRIIRGLLDQLGFHNIDEAADGRAALEMTKNKDYGLILSDWNMQPVTGIQFLTELRAGERNSKAPFVMVTAESRVENVVAARKAGVNQYIIKPFNLAVLKQKLSSVLGEF